MVTQGSLVERLVALRRAAGLTQAEVAARAGTSQPVIARLEAGERDPRLSTLERYARAVDTEVTLQPLARIAASTADRLAERIRARLGGEETATVTFREVIQFVDDLGRLSPREMAAAIQQEPLSTGDLRWDALIAGAVDWVIAAHAIEAPRWTGSARRRLAAPGWVVTPHRRLERLIRDNTPDELARHGVYVDRASLASV